MNYINYNKQNQYLLCSINVYIKHNLKIDPYLSYSIYLKKQQLEPDVEQ